MVARMLTERVQIPGVDAAPGRATMSPKERVVETGVPSRHQGEAVVTQIRQEAVEFTEQLVDIAAEIVRAGRPFDLRKAVSKCRQHRRWNLRQREEFPPCQGFRERGKEVRRIERESVEPVVALAIGAGREVGCESDRRIPGCCGIGGGRTCVNVPQGKGEQPAGRDSGLRQLIDRGGNIPEEPHARVLLPGVAKDPKKLVGGVDAAYPREQRIDLPGNSSARAGIDFGPEGADVHAIPPVT